MTSESYLLAFALITFYRTLYIFFGLFTNTETVRAVMNRNKSIRVSFVGACDVLQHIVCVKESKYGMFDHG